MNTPSSDRPALRKQLIAAREALSGADRALREAALGDHLRSLLERLEPRIIGFCWPFRGEPDLVGMLQQWRDAQPGRQLALPVVPAEPGPLAFHRWQAGDVMSADRYGIPTPEGTPRLEPDGLLGPVNGFDVRGFRIGYGGGYFDRTLALEPRPVSVGTGFELARLDDTQPQPHDLPLDWIVTEAGIVVGSR